MPNTLWLPHPGVAHLWFETPTAETREPTVAQQQILLGVRQTLHHWLCLEVGHIDLEQNSNYISVYFPWGFFSLVKEHRCDLISKWISGLPVVNIPSSIYTVVTGQDATIPCSVSANPAVTSSSWTFISASSSQTMITQSTSKYTLSTSSGNMTLVVRGTSSADSGTYRCSATNAEGTASDQTSLTVSGS